MKGHSIGRGGGRRRRGGGKKKTKKKGGGPPAGGDPPGGGAPADGCRGRASEARRLAAARRSGAADARGGLDGGLRARLHALFERGEALLERAQLRAELRVLFLQLCGALVERLRGGEADARQILHAD